MAIITPEAIVHKDFEASKGLKSGYDMDEVDEYLDALANSTGELIQQNTELRNQLQSVESRVADLARGDAAGFQAEVEALRNENNSLRQQVQEAGSRGSSANEAENATEIIVLAQKLHDDYVRTGQETADKTISEAEDKAHRIVSEAEDTSHRTLTKLEGDRALLERKIDELRLYERDYRMRLRAYLQNLLDDLDKKGEQVPTGNPQI
ncbi:MAG: DivIVA domain-containing protein [Cellulomonadaceae bacterium]|nr:DivIVA domain-containing protein [Cellulomonadaceae bacterium]